MKKTHNSQGIMHNWLRLLLLFVLLVGQWSAFNVSVRAQGITVKTRDGQAVNYPAEQFSHISPYVFAVSPTTFTYGVDVYKTDGTSDRYMENELEKIITYRPQGDETGETTVVPQTGGKVTMGNLTVDMPSGTFGSDTKVTIIEEEKGYVEPVG